jgi:hypothetical protein
MGVLAANSEVTAARKVRGRPFQKGCSGNPSGRPRRDHDLAARARAFTVEAVATLAQIMQDDGQPAAARISAASEILNRGYGKAPQHIDIKATVTIADEFEAFVRELNQPQLISAL